MDPAQQVREIINMMNPENPGTATDAVFLVQKYINESRAKLSAKDKQIALLEAKLQAEQQLRSDIENDKLKAEARLKKEKADVMAGKGVVAPHRKDKPPGRNL